MSIVCKIQMRNVFKLLWLSGYWSKHKLGKIVPLYLSFIMWKITGEGNQMSESMKQTSKKMLVKKWKEHKNDIRSRYALHIEQFYLTLYISQYPLIPLDLLFFYRYTMFRYSYGAQFSAFWTFWTNNSHSVCMHLMLSPVVRCAISLAASLSPRPAPFILHSKR